MNKPRDVKEIIHDLTMNIVAEEFSVERSKENDEHFDKLIEELYINMTLQLNMIIYASQKKSIVFEMMIIKSLPESIQKDWLMKLAKLYNFKNIDRMMEIFNHL